MLYSIFWYAMIIIKGAMKDVPHLWVLLVDRGAIFVPYYSPGRPDTGLAFILSLYSDSIISLNSMEEVTTVYTYVEVLFLYISICIYIYLSYALIIQETVNFKYSLFALMQKKRSKASYAGRSINVPSFNLLKGLFLYSLHHSFLKLWVLVFFQTPHSYLI